MLRSEAGLMNTEVKIEACPEPPSDDKLSVNEIHTRGDVDEQVAECVYKRGGWCYTHKMYGDKSVKKWSVWGQKRDGTFGYLSRSSTNYSCRKNSAGVYRPDIAISQKTGNSAIGVGELSACTQVQGVKVKTGFEGGLQDGAGANTGESFD